nr:MAG: coat protein [Narnaviridae sp.]
MNKSSVDLNKTVNSLVTAVGKLTNSQAPKKRAKKSKRNRNNVSGNPGKQPPKALLLNHDQILSTTPASFWLRVPASTPSGDRIRAREMVGSLVLTSDTTGNFALLNTLTISGGVTGLPLSPLYVPRLSAIASTFEFFKFHSASITFAPLSATTVNGRLFQCCDYDAKDNAPSSSVGMMSNVSAATSQIYGQSDYKIRSDLSRLPKYVVREAGSPDVNQTWQGNLFFAVEGFTGTAGQSVGYVFIEYDIEFYTPSQVQQ